MNNQHIVTTGPAAVVRQDHAWHGLSAADVLTQLGASTEGLRSSEAARRLASHGPNELAEGQRIRPFQILLGQFHSLIIWILVAAGVISGLLGEVVDCAAIFAIVVLNAAIGFYQEFKAEQSIAALKKLTAPQARVRRDSRIASLPARNCPRRHSRFGGR